MIVTFMYNLCFGKSNEIYQNFIQPNPLTNIWFSYQKIDIAMYVDISMEILEFFQPLKKEAWFVRLRGSD